MASRNAFSALRYVTKPISSNRMTSSFLDWPVRFAYAVMSRAAPWGNWTERRTVLLAPTLGLYPRFPVILCSLTCFWNLSFPGRARNLDAADMQMRSLSRSAVSQPCRRASLLR